jgi:hypothetical protein
VDTDEKKNDRFMIGLSTKLQEHIALNTGGTFPEFVSTIMIADDAIHAHKETKKRKVVAAPSSSAPPKYRTVYHHGPTYPPRPQHQQQHLLPTRFSVSTNGQHLRLYLPLRL